MNEEMIIPEQEYLDIYRLWNKEQEENAALKKQIMGLKSRIRAALARSSGYRVVEILQKALEETKG